MLISRSRTATIRRFCSAVLYTAALAAANTATADTADLEALRDGSMKKLNFAEKAEPVPDTALTTAEGGKRHLSDFRGKHVVLNFWATWCAPCREEMPSLDTLQAQLGGDSLAVVPVATGRNPLPAIRRFFDEEDVTNLPILRDPNQQLARSMGVLGLPVTVILDAEGHEIARLQGDADWSSASAIAILSDLATTR